VFLKKMSTILLLAVFLFNAGGYRLILSYLQSQSNNSIVQQPSYKLNSDGTATSYFCNVTNTHHTNTPGGHDVNITGIFAKFNTQNNFWKCTCFRNSISHTKAHNDATLPSTPLNTPGKPPNA
jgi:hypothetical protein